MLGGAVTIFKAKYAPQLEEFFHRDKLTRNEREVIVFGEYFGPKSYAGTHQVDDVKNVVIFDVMVGHKNRRFYKPFDFIDTFQSLVEIPPVLYTGNLTDQFISDVRNGAYTAEFHRLTDNKFPLFEGVICKGTANTGAFAGNMWQCKIKTQEYLDSLKNKFGNDWEKYGE
jgi:hypothetical protein